MIKPRIKLKPIGLENGFEESVVFVDLMVVFPSVLQMMKSFVSCANFREDGELLYPKGVRFHSPGSAAQPRHPGSQDQTHLYPEGVGPICATPSG